MSDISVDVNGYRVNLRVAAIVTDGKNVLICRMKSENYWFLPGGRIKTNESSAEAIHRELCEEVGDQFHIQRPLVCAENFFDLQGVSFHEFCTFYAVEWLGSSLKPQTAESNDVFKWVPKMNVTAVNLKPAFIKQYIIHPIANLDLIIHRDNE